MNINSWKIGPFPQILWLPQNCVCAIKSLQHNDVFDIQKILGLCQETLDMDNRHADQRREHLKEREAEEINRGQTSNRLKTEKENLESEMDWNREHENQFWKWNQKLDLDETNNKRKKREKGHEITNCAYRQIFINRQSYHNGMKLAQQN
ncbi:unnamed protein product [Paramecium octaurelia]|uniref:Uncharacterized protein n=1 Tax=Paramecium octaurelia TaxID=43137 RepID=A0A8S1VE54_PAROT|nr:unnamed protein product [Paramecium octaurelia]